MQPISADGALLTKPYDGNEAIVEALQPDVILFAKTLSDSNQRLFDTVLGSLLR